MPNPHPVWKRLRDEAPVYLQRAARLLRAEPLRRRARGAPRPGHVQLGAHDRARDDERRAERVHGVDHDLHGPAGAHALPQARQPRVHAAAHRRRSNRGPRPRGRLPRRVRRRRRLRLRRRLRRAAAGDGHLRDARRARRRTKRSCGSGPTRRCTSSPARSMGETRTPTSAIRCTTTGRRTSTSDASIRATTS